MSTFLEQLDQKVVDLQNAAVNVKSALEENRLKLIAIFANLEDVNIVNVSFDTSSLDLSVAGDKEMLKLVWRKLREMGYETTDTPDENSTSFYCWWYLDDNPTIWLSFTSTVCKRVKIGTEMQEVDIYEVQCE